MRGNVAQLINKILRIVNTAYYVLANKWIGAGPL